MEEFFSKLIDNYPNLKYALLDAQTFSTEHYGFPEIYYKIMETDKVRVGAYQQTFRKYNNLKDAVVCEAGVGRLALTQHFLPYVKKAYLIENNPNIIPYIKEQLAKNGWAHKVELIHGDALKVELPEKVDYLIGELMSIYCANEYQVQIFRHLRQFLKPEGKLIPEKILNIGQLCEAQYEDGHKHYPLLFTRHWPSLITSQEVVNTIDLYKDTVVDIDVKVPFNTLLSGSINSLFMYSWVQLAEGINFTGTDSLMPPTVTKLENSKELKAGEKTTLHAQYTYGTSLDKAKFRIE